MTTTVALNKPILRFGAQGSAVKELQMLLNDQFFSAGLVVDGMFGDVTELAVHRFQIRMFLTVDGIVGQQTWRSLYKRAPHDLPQLQVGSEGDLVRRLEERLAVNGDTTMVVDQVFTHMTATALAKMQRAQGLPGTGFTDDRTWLAVSRLPKL